MLRASCQAHMGIGLSNPTPQYPYVGVPEGRVRDVQATHCQAHMCTGVPQPGSCMAYHITVGDKNTALSWAAPSVHENPIPAEGFLRLTPHLPLCDTVPGSEPGA